MPDWFFLKLDGTILGIGFLITSLIKFIWGLASIGSGYDHCGDRSKPRYHWQRWLPTCFEFWLGVSLIGFDAALCLVIGVTLVRTPSIADLWTFLWLIPGTISFLVTFHYWARDRIPRRVP